ncbi:MAG: tRNA guanosine(34) transglycosylase Tgt [Nitrospirae bacterium]|nr:tRNA guanosine(34) transglycosylase Tgt [Nitrospirota bacterium]
MPRAQEGTGPCNVAAPGTARHGPWPDPRGGGARTGRMETPHGTVETPVFCPVASQGTIKAMTPEEVQDLGGQAILSNTYHLYLRPGQETIRKHGGLHAFMNWSGAIITDSGGYQVFSLANLKKVRDDGVEFQSHIDGSRHTFTPELAVRVQEALGSDVMMVLDECPPYPCSPEQLREAVRRTTEWARRCKSARGSHDDSTRRLRNGVEGAARQTDQALFGIVQGGIDADLRRASAESLVEIGFDGYALGGLSVGEPKTAMLETVEATLPHLPIPSPRYLMGVGAPEDIIESIHRGIDIFDCIIPTRHARTGILYGHTGPVKIMHQRYREDSSPIDPGCGCYACRHFSRSYLRHLHAAKEILAARLGTIHNLHFYFSLLRESREAIRQGAWPAFRTRFLAAYDPSGG